MSLNLKTICSWNVQSKPFSHNIFNNILKWRSFMEESTDNTIDNTDEELNIICVQGIYDFRTGFIGKLFTLLAYHLSRYSNPIYIQSILKLYFNCDANDFEIVAFLISILTRIIPVNNMYNFRNKDLLNTLGYTNMNYSEPSAFNMRSLFLLNPLFDSGCVIYSNRRAIMSGFQRWYNSIQNKGMTWSYFESYNNEKGITVINIDIDSEYQTIPQLIEFVNNLQNRFSVRVDEYETYITGQFNIPFNMSGVMPEVDIAINQLNNANIKIIETNSELSSTEFIMYSTKETVKNHYNFYNMSSLYLDTNSMFHKINFKNGNNRYYTINPMHNPVYFQLRRALEVKIEKVQENNQVEEVVQVNTIDKKIIEDITREIVDDIINTVVNNIDDKIDDNISVHDNHFDNKSIHSTSSDEWVHI